METMHVKCNLAVTWRDDICHTGSRCICFAEMGRQRAAGCGCCGKGARMSVSFSTDDREEVALAELSLDDAQKAERGIALASSVVAYKDLMMTYSCAAKIVDS